jgi:serine/threonine protein kinase
VDPGQIVGARFEVVELAGSGGMGTVHRARDLETGESVALKMLRAGREEHDERFLREATVLSDLRHVGIVRYVAHGVTDEGQPYLAMEWVDGETLADRLARQGLSLDESLALGLRVADALSVLHQRGIVHRDLKPSNLMLDGSSIERVKILDFGIAWLAGREGILTRTGAMVGTPGFMAPEQARGEGQLDARVDIFALGCVLYRCLTGRAAFAGKDPLAILLKVMLEEAPRPSKWNEEVPPALDDLVARMLAKTPADRPRDAAAVAAHIRSLPASRSERIPSVLPPAALTTIERRVICLVLARLMEPVGPPVPPGAQGTGGKTPPASKGSPASSASRAAPASPRATPAPKSAPADALPTTQQGPPPRRKEHAPAAAKQPETPTMPAIFGSRLRTLRQAAERFQAKLDVLADGSVAVVLSEAGAATDLAARGARCALAMSAGLGATTVVAMGQGVVHASAPVGEVIDRAVRMLGADAERQTGSRPGGVGGSEPPKGTARRLPHPVLLDDVTAGLLDEQFDVRGDARGLYLLGERATTASARTLLGKPTPCVGRERELTALAGIFDECTSEPVARAVLVTAPAGVGKSRLRYELVQRIQGRGDRVSIWTGRGDPMGAGSPLGMLAAALRRAIGLLEGEPLIARQKKLAARVGRHFAPPERARVTEFLGELVGVPFPEDSSVQLKAARQDALLMGDQMRSAFEDFVAAECAAQPVWLILEDLHWGDVPTVRFVDAALRRLRDQPFLVVAFGRPEVHTLFPKLWEERGLLEVRLLELTRKASEKLVRQVLGDSVEQKTVELIVERAAGNAFYLEELIRAVAEGRGRTLPDTVLAMVQARLEGLEPAARRALRAASIFGDLFWADGVLQLLGGAASRFELADQLATLADQEVITARTSTKFPAEKEYSFRHALVREVAYSMLTDEDRALGHRLAGAWLERVGETDPLVLAEHFERGGEPERAVVFFRRAAEHALEGSDLDDTIARAERGIACGATGEIRGVLRLLQAEAHVWRGQGAVAEPLGVEALDLLPRGSPLWYRLTGGGVLNAATLGNYERLVLLVSVLRDEQPKGEGGEASRALAWSLSSWLLLFLGQRDMSKIFLEKLEELAGSIGDRDAGALGWVSMARYYWTKLVDDDLEMALVHAREAAASFERTGDFRTTGAANLHVSWAFLELGGYAEAEAVLLDVLAVGERRGIGVNTAHAKRFLAPALALQGKLEEGVAQGREAKSELSSNQLTRGVARKEIARILILMGDLDGAVVEALESLDFLAFLPYHRAHALSILAQARLAQGRPADALASAREALGAGLIADGDALARLVVAEALHALGRIDEARAAIAGAKERLGARAAKITDEARRRRFLSEITENARTLELAAAWRDPLPQPPLP